ncbi:MAG TPA: geranylgeranyl reductase family protein [Nitrospirota bacterium]|nr:geranylgeranyl reductase family protein [Nitrospirota bacterium]
MYDIIIVGAGPAGSTCGRLCGLGGLKTLLLDKDTFPRSKPCAGAISEHALSLLDFNLPGDIVEQECHNVRIHCGGRVIEAGSTHRFGIIVSRRNFDAFLVRKAEDAGVHLSPGEQVASIRENPGSVSVTTAHQTYEGRFLVGADGIHSIVARSIRPALAKDEMALALVSQTPAADADIAKRLGKTLEIYFGEAPMGYGWLFPHREYYSSGIAGLASRFSRPRESLAYLLKGLSIEGSGVQGHFIPFGGIKRTIAKGRILLIGDAAGFADPFHGEGILYAILSGKLAARAVADTLRVNDRPAAAVAQYCREANQHIVKQLNVALHMAKALDRHPRLFLRMFFDHPEALQRYLDIPSGTLSYRGFRNWVLARTPLLLLPRLHRHTNVHVSSS